MSDAAETRHFTATGFVVHNGATLLHWHHRVQAWLPPGGHIEPDEDPVQAVLREIREETGLEAEIVPASPLPEISNLHQLHPPRTILVEDVYDDKVGKHQHIDLIYFTRVVGDDVDARDRDSDEGHPEVPKGWVWVERDELEAGTVIAAASGEICAPPEDVVVLGIAALD